MAESCDLLTYAIVDYHRGFTPGGAVLRIYFGHHINNRLSNSLTVRLRELLTGYGVLLV